MRFLTFFFVSGSLLAQSSLVDRMMAFDKNRDGKLTREEITDERLLRLFERADANHDGIVTKEELQALEQKESQEFAASGGGRGPGGRGGGPGRGGFGPPQPGQILPSFQRERLNLSEEQIKKLDALQKEVDAKLAAILTADQKQQLTQQGPPRDR